MRGTTDGGHRAIAAAAAAQFDGTFDRLERTHPDTCYRVPSRTTESG